MCARKEGLLVTLSGPSGVGKDTILKLIVERSAFRKFAAYTTRPMRLGEINGVDYKFVSQGQFDATLLQTSFFDHLVVNGFSYGTPWEDFYQILESGERVIIHLSVGAALKLKKEIPSTVTVFLMPPSGKELSQRMAKRGMSQEAIEARFQDEPNDVRRSLECDLIVINYSDEEREVAERILRYIDAATGGRSDMLQA